MVFLTPRSGKGRRRLYFFIAVLRNWEKEFFRRLEGEKEKTQGKKEGSSYSSSCMGEKPKGGGEGGEGRGETLFLHRLRGGKKKRFPKNSF